MTARPERGQRPDLAAAAAVECLGVSSADRVLVLTNEPQEAMGGRLLVAAERIAGSAKLMTFEASTRHGEEPPTAVADALACATAAFALTSYSISHTRARESATARGVRMATMGGVTEEIFERALPVDYEELKRTSERVARALTSASSCRITSPSGTDLRLELEGREGISDDGHYQQPAAWGNLPAGEAFIAPLETRGTGQIVFDGSLAGYGMLTEPLRVVLDDGRVVDASGRGADWLLRTLDAGGPNGRSIAELGIGTNPSARLVGHVCEDEKVAGTAHLAFGTSASIGGVNVADVHIDGVLREPCIELDGRTLMKDARLQFDAFEHDAAAPTETFTRPRG